MSIPSLKRPRSTSPSSSPKRAASDENFPSSSSSGRGDGFLNPMSSGNAAGSSPLRLQSETDDAGWVERTGDVHIASSSGQSVDGDDATESEIEHKSKLRAQYDELLVAISPPFKQWEAYYIIPASILKDLKALIYEEPSVDLPSAALPRIDLTGLIKDPRGEEVFVIATQGQEDGSYRLASSANREIVWEIKDGLVENEDFTFISAAGWRSLLDWYGPYDGPSLRRFCQPGERIQMVPPVYTLHIVGSSDTSSDPIAPVEDKPSPVRFSCPSDTPLSLLIDLAKTLVRDNLDKDAPARVWTLIAPSEAETLPALSALHLSATLLPSLSGRLLSVKSANNNISCTESGLEPGDVIAIEVGKKMPIGGTIWTVGVNEQGKAVEKAATEMTVPKAPAPLFSKPAMYAGSGQEASSSRSSDSGVQTRSRSAPKKGKGLVGLVNLGNTCFMNSAVQCLSNTQELNEYFLSGVYRDELNPDNPLGMGGQIAEAFGGTIESLWAPAAGHSSYSPRNLKWTTSRFAPQFAGYGQHDTQEFIAFLLDGLHEDLNRIKKKPYIEKPDWKPGGGDLELAELGKQCWDGYKKRNDSVIVDLFQGQLRSTLVCPECHKESITLDPFMYLTVPLPIAQTRVFKCHFVPLNPEEPPVKVRLLIPQNASFAQVKERLGTLTGAKASNMVGFDLWHNAVYNWWIDSDHNSEAKDSDIAVFFELASTVSSTRKAVGTLGSDTTITVPVYTFKPSVPNKYSSRRTEEIPADCAALPFFITLSRSEASDSVAVREAITKGYERLVRPEVRAELRVHSGSRRAASALPLAEALGSGEDEEPVTEIHLDGDQARVIEVSSARSTDGNADLESSMTLPVPSRTASYASISDAASVKSSKSGRLVPRGDLFKVHVADASSSDGTSNFDLLKKKDPAVPFYKGSPSSASGSWSKLEQRRKPKRNMLGSITSGFRAMVGSASAASDDEPSPPATPVHAPLVVRPGEGIFCEWSTKNFNEFFESSYALETGEAIIDPAIEKEAAKKKEGRAISLEDCLDEFSKEETLGQDDLWYCPQCKKHQAATKKLEIYQAPDILVICIKRFGSSRRLSDKLDNLVSFPPEGLDLGDRIGERKVAKSLQLSDEDAAKYGIEAGDDPTIYDLYAVDNHFGGMGGGHYTAFCKNKVDGEWYNYDDSRVSKASVESVQSRAAYLLFYRRRTKRPIGGISRVKAEEASRAASPVPSSPEQLPAAVSMSRNSSSGTSSTDPIVSGKDSDDQEGTPPPSMWNAQILTPPTQSGTDDGDELPSYSGRGTSSMPSPTVSDDGEVKPKGDLGALGEGIGFGNTAWGVSAPVLPPGVASLRNESSLASSPPTSTDAGSEGVAPPSPPTTDDGLGGRFEFIKNVSSNDEEDVEMISAPRSPIPEARNG